MPRVPWSMRVARGAALAASLAACGDNIEVIPVPDPPQVVTGGGPVLAAPEIVPIFFIEDGEVVRGGVERFLGELQTSAYWTATTAEYGIGPPTIDATIILDDPPPTTDTELQMLIESHVPQTGLEPLAAAPAFPDYADWPRANANTVYVVFLPGDVTLTVDGDTSCKDFGGYHDETNARGIVYALLPRCPTNGSAIEELTPPTSHELIEAATDPHPNTNPAWNGIDEPDLIWSFTPGSEVGDMCEYVAAADQQLVGDFTVQRTWSNVSAAAGHDPCVPNLPGPYVRAVPLLDQVTLDYGNGEAQTLGVEIPNGESRTIGLRMISDSDAPAWSVGADDVAVVVHQLPAQLGFTLDKNTGSAGDTLQLTVKRLKEGTGGGSEFVVTTKVGSEIVSLWWGLATN